MKPFSLIGEGDGGRVTQYFERPGPINTNKVIEICKRRAEELEIHHIVVASLTGDSAVRVAEAFRDLEVSVVSVRYLPGGTWKVREDSLGAYTFEGIPELRRIREEWTERGLERIPIDYSTKNLKRLDELGVRVIGGTPTLYNINRSLLSRFGGLSLQEVINETLRLFCPGLRVCVEAALMAADNGAIPTDEESIVMAGTERGLDTADILKPSVSVRMFDLYDGMEIREIICKPRTMRTPSGRFIGRYRVVR